MWRLFFSLFFSPFCPDFLFFCSLFPLFSVCKYIRTGIVLITYEYDCLYLVWFFAHVLVLDDPMWHIFYPTGIFFSPFAQCFVSSLFGFAWCDVYCCVVCRVDTVRNIQGYVRTQLTTLLQAGTVLEFGKYLRGAWWIYLICLGSLSLPSLCTWAVIIDCWYRFHVS